MKQAGVGKELAVSEECGKLKRCVVRPASLILLMCMAVALAAGCTTPAARIRKNPDLFNSFPPEVQQNVRSGHIEVGYTKDMVFIACGRPDRVRMRKTDAGESTAWIYTGARFSSSIQPVDQVYWHRDRRGRLHYMVDRDWIDVGQVNEYEALRVEFADDKATAIEYLSPYSQ